MAGNESSSSSSSSSYPIAAASVANPCQPIINTDLIAAVSIANPGQPLINTDHIVDVSIADPNEPLPNTALIAAITIANLRQPHINTNPSPPLINTDPVEHLVNNDHIADISIANPNQILPNTYPIDVMSIDNPGQSLIDTDHITDVLIANPSQPLPNVDPIVAIFIANPGQPLINIDVIDDVSIANPSQPLSNNDPIDIVSINNPNKTFSITAPQLSTRRPPPPCWAHEEILALIDCYYDKWNSLHCRFLRAIHWEEIAVAISQRCQSEIPKTSIQCRNKMDKLRRRLQSEKKRSLNCLPNTEPWSYWLYFSKLDAMERGILNSSLPSQVDVPPEVDVEDDVDEYDVIRSCRGTTQAANGGGTLRFEDLKTHGSKLDPSGVYGRVARHRQSSKPITPYGVFDGMKPSKLDGSGADEMSVRLLQSLNPSRRYGRFDDKKSSMHVMDKKRGREERYEEGEHKNVFGALASTMEMLTDCYLRMELKKMAMAREREKMWMEMEKKKTELLMNYQRSMMESLANVFLGKKKRA